MWSTGCSPLWNKAKPETQGRTWSIDNGGTSLMGSPPLALQLLCLYNPGGLASNGSTHSGLGPRTSIVNQENTPEAYPQASPLEVNPDWGCSSQATLGKLNKTNRNSMSEKLILMRQTCYGEVTVYLSLQHPTIWAHTGTVPSTEAYLMLVFSMGVSGFPGPLEPTVTWKWLREHVAWTELCM